MTVKDGLRESGGWNLVPLYVGISGGLTNQRTPCTARDGLRGQVFRQLG